MSGLFGKPKIQQTIMPAAPNPRDDEDRLTTERIRRSAQFRGRSSTIMTRFMDNFGAGAAPVRTVTGA